MLIRDSADLLAPGAYLVGAGPESASLDLAALRRCLTEALGSLNRETR